MKFVRIAAAMVLTILMLYVARTNSMGRPDNLGGSDGAFSFELTTIPKILEHSTDRLWVKITGPKVHQQVWLRTTQMGNVAKEDLRHYTRLEMHPAPELGEDVYAIFVQAGDRGGRFWYYFEITDASRQTVATFMPADGEPFLLKYIGAVPSWITTLHILFIFATVFLISLATIHGVRLALSGGEARPMMRLLLWATVMCFVGMIPFGIPMNYYAFDGSWEGVPFGHDATDNKTQLLFVWLLFATLSGLGSLSNGKCGRNVWGVRGLGWLGTGSFLVMLFIYLIPHSIQFTPMFTYVFCYSWIGAVFSLYLIGWWRSRRAAVAS